MLRKNGKTLFGFPGLPTSVRANHDDDDDDDDILVPWGGSFDPLLKIFH